ncbi:inducible metalloproteinase inhibitor protein-like [Hylaeus volcanicus]|uniref:inducible metalloproteinase inhibitor protein-like n=1 Tax=Hylaeus volcanicus TaxID=313075 RepID=UPI0023B7B0DC|nr:inducible metalloproteinase inhibitor protein-like [Hylaeus volcanicus]
MHQFSCKQDIERSIEMHKVIFVLFAALAILSATTFAAVLVCDRKNEEYACGSACQTTCSNLNQTCPIVNIRCNDACYCKAGYARIRGDNSPCIPIERCPKKGRKPSRLIRLMNLHA